MFSATENDTSSYPGPPAADRRFDVGRGGDEQTILPFFASSRSGVDTWSPNLQRADPLRPSKPGKKSPETVTSVDSRNEPPIGAIISTVCG